MRLVLISDTHNLHSHISLPSGDILIHAGDLTTGGKMKELQNVAEWLREQRKNFAHVIAIGGNHDFVLEAFMKEQCEQYLPFHIFKGVHYLRDSSVVIDGKKFYGSPWTASQDWAFSITNKNPDKGPTLKDKFDQIPEDTDVLITHAPPYGILDYFWQQRLGSEDLADRIRIVKPEVHVFGHIHNAYGYRLQDGVQYFNAAVTEVKNDMYHPGNEPWVVEI